ncbi:hypothetical protein [Trichococcus ilyis]|uniref:Uncharacterized protein n=1 Tax=Trichococcus ilyis TaxID=640938 RepID=A0A143Z848_9LACT|nr:hypothetical protein [Trichococcus ilyis]CZR09885.1 Hypothetical protein TR210_2820 [Trichococcus ilyis]SEJ87283.1 hypothetical protein SAMN05216375_13324 [Trichococcus ilyis]
MSEKSYELSTATKNSLEVAQSNYETVVSEVLPEELEDSKDMILSQLNLKPKKLYMRARMELADNPELTTVELRDLLINDLLKNTKSKLLRMVLKHAIKKSLKEKRI